MSTRKSYSPNENLILYNEVNGICPLCSLPLTYKKKKIEKVYEIAHIYPLNPKPEEVIELQGVKKLYSTDSNDIENVICLCPNCHTKFDKPRTRKEYEYLYKIKYDLLAVQSKRQKWYEFRLEAEIEDLIVRLANDDYQLSSAEDIIDYDPKEVDKKLDATIGSLLHKKISNNVSEFYPIVSQIFKQRDFESPLTTEKVSAQIKLFYLDNCGIENNQKEIFNNTVQWIHDKTGKYSIEAAEILASYFVQNCELFEV